MLGWRFSFEVYAKNVKEKATKCYLKTTGILLDADGHFASLNLTFMKVK